MHEPCLLQNFWLPACSRQCDRHGMNGFHADCQAAHVAVASYTAHRCIPFEIFTNTVRAPSMNRKMFGPWGCQLRLVKAIFGTHEQQLSALCACGTLQKSAGCCNLSPSVWFEVRYKLQISKKSRIFSVPHAAELQPQNSVGLTILAIVKTDS